MESDVLSFLNCLNKIKKEEENKQYILCYANIWNIAYTKMINCKHLANSQIKWIKNRFDRTKEYQQEDKT